MPQAVSLQASTLLRDIDFLPASTRTMFEREDIQTVADLLQNFLPARHEDRRHFTFTGFQPTPTPVCHHLLIQGTRRIGFGRNAIIEATCTSASSPSSHQQLILRWFSMPYLQKILAADMQLIAYGKIKEIKSRLIMDHPDYEILSEEDQEPVPNTPRIHSGRIVPIYRLRGSLKQKPLRAAIWDILQHLDPTSFSDILPPAKANGEFSGLSHFHTLRILHAPDEFEQLDKARRYLALEEFYLLQLRLLQHRRKLHLLQQTPHTASASHVNGKLYEAFLKQLPFDLTIAQQRCLEEIRADISAPSPMNRLLHGDVGSGKTVVALASALHAIEAGHQAALMAPTQILAEQHYQNAVRWLAPLGLRIALRTADKKIICRGDLTTSSLPSPHHHLPNHLPHLIIGTHALLHDRDATLSHLGLAIIDEQHKFGVAQRARLIHQNDRVSDVLVMTATPIPRTLTLTLYGDLDISTINERPRQRGKIITAIRENNKLRDITAFLKTQLGEGRQIYLVHPLIEESEKIDAEAAVSGYEAWCKRLKPYRVGLLHGRIDSENKDQIIREFRDNQIQALVTTTVIEVGVDVPNATVMLIHNADRFGLAQLHQLRGRIGRGSHTSYCILLIDKNDAEARQKLSILEQTSDGFIIAEEDLNRRGPGDLLGQMQSGQAPLRFHELLADTRLITLARRIAERTLASDPDLLQPEHAHLKPFLLDTPPLHTTLQ